MGNRNMFVGLDVHKETIDVAIAEGRRDGKARHFGVIASDLEPLDKVVRALRASDRRLHFVYEAGPCGFGIYRHLRKRGEECVVVSPSMVPKRSGDRVKTDRRDSVALARLHRAGELRAIYVPDDADEAMRDLVRAREDAVVAVGPGGRRAPSFTRRVVHHRRRLGGRTRGPDAIWAPARTDGLSGTRAVGIFQWPERTTRRHHEGGQSARPASARGSGLGLSGDSSDWSPACVSAGSAAEARVRHRVEGPAAVDDAVPAAGRAGQG